MIVARSNADWTDGLWMLITRMERDACAVSSPIQCRSHQVRLTAALQMASAEHMHAICDPEPRAHAIISV